MRPARQSGDCRAVTLLRRCGTAEEAVHVRPTASPPAPRKALELRTWPGEDQSHAPLPSPPRIRRPRPRTPPPRCPRPAGWPEAWRNWPPGRPYPSGRHTRSPRWPAGAYGSRYPPAAPGGEPGHCVKHREDGGERAQPRIGEVKLALQGLQHRAQHLAIVEVENVDEEKNGQHRPRRFGSHWPFMLSGGKSTVRPHTGGQAVTEDAAPKSNQHRLLTSADSSPPQPIRRSRFG